MSEQNKSEYTYYAFISYKREDEKWAKWLQKKLESYGFPVGLRKDNPSLPSKIRPIFRDQSELSGGNLKEEIEKGLTGSKYLIVICSPRSAQSPWVSKEVQYFIDNGRADYIIPFIIGGSPNAKNPEEECFPEGLRQLSGEKEILGININEMGRDAATIKVIARMFGLRFDTLWQRHERAKRRKRFAIIAGVVTFALISLTVAGIMLDLKQQANRERDRANEKTEEALRANKSLEIANDSIKRQSSIISQTNKDLAQSKKNLEQTNQNLEQANRDLAESNRQLAEERDNVLKANWRMMENRARAVAEKAKQLIDEGDSYTARLLCLEVLPKNLENPEIPYVPEVESVFRSACQSNEFKTTAHNYIIRSVAISNNKGMIATCAENIKLWDRKTGECILTIEMPEEYGVVSNIVFSPDGSKIASSIENEIFVWDISTGDCTLRLSSFDNKGELSNEITSLTYSPDNQWIITGLFDGRIFIWNNENGELINTINNGNYSIESLACNLNGIIVSSDAGKNINVWNGLTREKINSFFNFESIAHKVRFESDFSDYIIYDNFERGSIYRRCIYGSDLQAIVHGIKNGFNEYVYRPDFDFFYYRAPEYIIFSDKYCYNSFPYKEIGEYVKMDIDANCDNLVYSDNQMLYMCDTRLDRSDRSNTYDTHGILAINSDGSRLVTRDLNSTLQFRYLDTCNDIMEIDPRFVNIALSPDGSKVAAFTFGKDIKIWDFNTGQLINVLKINDITYGGIVFSPNNKYLGLVSEQAGEDNDGQFKLIIWDMATYNIVRNCSFNESEGIFSIALSSDANILVYSTDDKINFMDINQSRVFNSINDSGDFVISKDGKLIAITNHDAFHVDDEQDKGNIRIWSLSDGACIYSIDTPTMIYSLAFSEDNRYIYSGGYTKSYIWDLPTLQDLIYRTNLLFKNRKLSSEERRKYYLE